MRTRKKKERFKMKTGEKKKLEFVENLIEHLDREECKVYVLQGIISGLKQITRRAQSKQFKQCRIIKLLRGRVKNLRDQLAIERSERLKVEAINEGLKMEMDSICGGGFNHGA